MQHDLDLLGVPCRTIHEARVPLPAGRAVQLGGYLALRGDWVARDEVLALLWPDADPKRARHTLAQLVYGIRRSDWGADLESEAARLRWLVPCDVDAFRRAASEGAWSRADALYGGELLQGVDASGADPFDRWLSAEREELRETWREAALAHAAELMDKARWSDAARRLRRLLADDDLLEAAVQALVRCEARAGRRDAALRTYDAFRERLGSDLGLAPLDVTSALAEAVRDGRIGPDREAAHDAPSDPAPPGTPAQRASATPHSDPRAVRPGPVRNLPADATPFMGRALELAELHGLLAAPDRRLVTLLGPGGAGKSRLAGRLARERSGHFEHGAVWIVTAGTTDEDSVHAVIAAALGLAVDPHGDALIGALSTRETLLVLDAAEDATALPGWITTLLERAPRIRVLTTSRVPLDVPDETLVPVRGLALPPHDDAPDAEAYDAVGMVLRAAQRVRPGFHPIGREREATVALTRTLEGSPLAIELASGWLRVLEPSELLAEVRRDLGVLTSRDADTDPRHASMRAVFESAWALLAPRERDALRRLSVFEGGVTRATADEVAGVALGSLLALVNRSLLRRADGARFTTHALVAAFAREKGEERPDERRALERAHAEAFASLAAAADAELDTPRHQDALRRLDAEQANVRAALRRALAAPWPELACRLASSLQRYWGSRGLAREGRAWTRRALAWAGDEAVPPALAVRTRLAAGLLSQATGAYDEAERTFLDAEAEAERHGLDTAAAWARGDRALIAWRRGRLEEARELVASTIPVYRQAGQDVSLAAALGLLGNVQRDGGDPAASHASYDAALAVSEALGQGSQAATVRNNKAIAYAYEGDLPAALEEFERALELQRAVGDLPGTATALINVGNVHLDTGNPDGARERYREALAICDDIGDRATGAHVHVNLGILAQRAERYDDAHEAYGAALRIRRLLGARSLAVQCVSCFLDLAVARGQHERALVLAGAVRAGVEATAVPLTPPQQTTYDAARSAARAMVPAARADELERRGAALGEAEAVTYALATRAEP